MEKPTLIEIINKLETVPIDSWKGVNRGGSYSKEKETEKIRTRQTAYSTKMDDFTFTIFSNCNKYNIRVISKSFCERYESKRKRLGSNVEFKKLRDLTQKLYDSALERETKEYDTKLKKFHKVLDS